MPLAELRGSERDLSSRTRCLERKINILAFAKFRPINWVEMHVQARTYAKFQTKSRHTGMNRLKNL